MPFFNEFGESPADSFDFWFSVFRHYLAKVKPHLYNKGGISFSQNFCADSTICCLKDSKAWGAFG